MINQIHIDVDTNREKPIIFSKPPHIPIPETKESEIEMIMNDIISLSQSLKHLVLIAGYKNYINKKSIVDAIIVTVKEALTENSETNELELPNH